MTSTPLVLKFSGTANLKSQSHNFIITVQQTSDEQWEVSIGSPNKSRSFDTFLLKYKAQDSLDDIKEKTLQ